MDRDESRKLENEQERERERELEREQERNREDELRAGERAAERDRDRGTNPPRTTTGRMTAPKFGSATSGGGEFEPGPERD